MSLSNEAKVGIFTTVGIVILLLSTVYISNITVFQGGYYKVNVLFDSTPDLKLRAKVKFGGGVDIGTVGDISITPEKKIKVELLVKKEHKINRDTTVSVTTSGVMGEKYVNITRGTDDAGYVAANETLEGINSGGIDAAINNLNEVSNEFKKALSQLFQGGDLQKSLSGSVKNVNDLSKGVKEIVNANKDSINKSVENFRKASEELSVATTNLKDLVSQLNKLVVDVSKSNVPETMNNLNKISVKLDETITSLDSAAKKLDKGEGTLGVLINDKKMAEDLKDFIKDVKANPWKLLWKK